MKDKIVIEDLRSAIAALREMEGELLETDVEVDPEGEIAGIYKRVGAGGTIARPTKQGPALLFHRVKGFPGLRCSIGVMGTRERTAALLGTMPDKMVRLLSDAVNEPIAPILVSNEKAPCQEIIRRADEPDFDLRKIVMGTHNAPEDAGPYITMGIIRARDPETGQSDVTIHRMVIVGKDEIGIMAKPGGRHIGDFHFKAEQAGKPLPLTINIGCDPAVTIGTTFSAPTTPLGTDELGTAGALRGKPVELVRAATVDETAIAKSEIVIEGMLMPETRVREDRVTGSGRTMAEFMGYTGSADEVPLIKVTAVTHRRDPILQVCLGNSYEHVMMSGLPAAAGIFSACEKALPGRVVNVYCPPAGGGKLMAILQIRKTRPGDDGEQINAGLLAFGAYHELKHVILVDDDVDLYDMSDVVWAMNTRFQAHLDLVKIEGARAHPAEISAQPAYDPSNYARGITCKAIFDCTVKYQQKEMFRRSPFLDIDPENWFPRQNW